MRKVQLNGKTVLVRRVGSHYVAQLDGQANRVFALTEEDCLEKLRKQAERKEKVCP
jgi:hypothetical protein